MSKTLERFTLGQEVVIQAQGLRGAIGRVVRLRKADEGAWINLLSRPLPDELRSFPASDERANHILLYPDECAKA